MLVERHRSAVLLLAFGLLSLAAVVGVALLRPERSNSTWSYYRAHGPTVEVFKTVRACDEILGAEAVETADRVEVTLHVKGGGTCAAIAVDKSFKVALDQSLGDRLVYDGTCLASGNRERQCLRSQDDVR